MTSVGAALLCMRHDDADADAGEAFRRVGNAFPRHVRGLTAEDITDSGVRLRVWSDAGRSPAVARDAGSGAWLAIAGNPTRSDLRSLSQQGVMGRLLEECLRDGPEALDGISPPFVAVFRGPRENVTVTVDRCGIQHAYVHEDSGGRAWVTSSSLSVAAALGLPLDVDGLSEWLAVGHFIDGRTFFRGMRKLGSGERIRLDGPRTQSLSSWAPEPGGAATSASYRCSFLESLGACYRDEPVAAELTGGLDTRLLLAGQLTLGLPGFSWTIGQPGCDELVTIAKLKPRASFDHHPVAVGNDLAVRIGALAEEMHILSDGEVNALEYAPLLIAFDDLRDRRTISITGSGGENARGFYFRVLKRGGDRVRGVPVDALFHQVTKFTAGIRSLLRPELVAFPDAAAQTAIHDFVTSSPGGTAEAILEDFYIRARMQRFAGRNITTTGLFCRQGLPFFGNDLVDVTTALPVEAKRDGRVVREAIMALQPQLASVPLDTGVPVPPPSVRRPDVAVRRTLSLARRALVKFGGPVGHALAARPPETIPWDAVRTAPEFREFLHDRLLGPDARVADLFKDGAVDAQVRSAVNGGSLYPVGLLLTIELTLRRLAAGAS